MSTTDTKESNLCRIERPLERRDVWIVVEYIRRVILGLQLAQATIVFGPCPKRTQSSAAMKLMEGITGEAVRVSYRANLFEATLWTLVLSDGDGPVERNNW